MQNLRPIEEDFLCERDAGLDAGEMRVVKGATTAPLRGFFAALSILRRLAAAAIISSPSSLPTDNPSFAHLDN